MRRQPPLSVEFILSRLAVDVESGTATWIDATKHHRHLIGKPAGCRVPGRRGKDYWVIRLNGIGYRRSHIIFAVKTGAWPTQLIDHRDGNSLNDKGDNLRPATQAQNCWNIKTQRKASGLPMGVRELTPGRYQARIAVNKESICLGVHETAEAASFAYQQARSQHFGEFA